MEFGHQSNVIATVAAAVFYTNKNHAFILLSQQILLFNGFIDPFLLRFLILAIHAVWDADTLQNVTNVYGYSFLAY